MTSVPSFTSNLPWSALCVWHTFIHEHIVNAGDCELAVRCDERCTQQFAQFKWRLTEDLSTLKNVYANDGVDPRYSTSNFGQYMEIVNKSIGRRHKKVFRYLCLITV